MALIPPSPTRIAVPTFSERFARGLKASMAPRVEFNPAPPPSLSTGVKGEREVKRRATSFATVSGGSGHVADEVIVDDVLQPDAPFEADPYESSRYIDGDVRAVSSRAIVFDSDGALIDWPWESGSARHTGGKRRRHRLDRIVQQACSPPPPMARWAPTPPEFGSGVPSAQLRARPRRGRWTATPCRSTPSSRRSFSS